MSQHRFNELDSVMLAEDCRALGLKAGTRGAIVAVYGDHQAYEVEFIDGDGYTIALTEFAPHELRPVQEAA